MLQGSSILDRNGISAEITKLHLKFQKLYWVCNSTIYLADKIPFKTVFHGAGDGLCSYVCVRVWGGRYLPYVLRFFSLPPNNGLINSHTAPSYTAPT